MDALANQLGEKTLFGRTGGAATLAVGMAQIFSKVVNGRGLDLWYHFAIMFEALFILTTLDAGTRVGRYLLQDALGQIWRPLGQTGHLGANLLASLLMVSAWGYFLIQGVRDPLGGINSLWPLFGIANQLLAAIALCLATTIVLKMQLAPAETPSGRPRSGNPFLALVTFIPLLWLLAATMTAGVEKIGHPDPRIGFLAQASALDQAKGTLERALDTARIAGDAPALEQADKALRTNRVLHFNNILDAAVAAALLVLTILIVAVSAREWHLLLRRRRAPLLRETSPVWLREDAISGGQPGLAGVLPVAFALLKELSVEGAVERANPETVVCQSCQLGVEAGPDRALGAPAVEATGPTQRGQIKRKAQAYVEATERRYQGVTRCC
jgi:carbon starvation protein